MAKPILSSGKKKFLDGYIDDVRFAGPNHLAPPSVNVDITKTGEAVYGKGYIATSFDLNNNLKASRPFHVSRYDVTFFAINGKVLFVNHNNNDAVVDTGLSLTETDGRKTRFGEFAGDIYLTNTTDGLRQIHMGRVNDSAANAGDSTFTIDQDLYGRLAAFGDTTSTMRFATSTPFTEAVSSIASTGVVTLSNTLDQTVPDNTIVYTVEDISSGRPKASGIAFWKERMILWGVIYDTAVDTATNVVYLSSFANLTALENIIDFNVANTAAVEMVGKDGEVTNILPTKDYIYAFTKNGTYFAGVGDIDTTTGGTPFQLLSDKYGCANEDCSADIGDGVCIFLTNNKRVIGIRISSQSGAPVVFPDETFDSAISNTLSTLESDLSDAHIFYAPNDRKAYIHVNADSSRIVLKYNTEIKKWEPPRTDWSFGGMYVRNGVTYATELTDDAVWQIGVGYQNNGIDYEKVIGTALIEDVEAKRTLKLSSVTVSGRGSELATITVESYVSGGTPQQKSFEPSVGASSGSLGSVSLGSSVLGSGLGTDLVDYDKLFAIYPTYGSTYQMVIRSVGAFTLSSYSVFGSALGKPLLTLQ